MFWLKPISFFFIFLLAKLQPVDEDVQGEKPARKRSAKSSKLPRLPIRAKLGQSPVVYSDESDISLDDVPCIRHDKSLEVHALHLEPSLWLLHVLAHQLIRRQAPLAEMPTELSPCRAVPTIAAQMAAPVAFSSANNRKAPQPSFFTLTVVRKCIFGNFFNFAYPYSSSCLLFSMSTKFIVNGINFEGQLRLEWPLSSNFANRVDWLPLVD